MNALVQVYPTYPFELVAGSGDRVRAADGREFVDFYGGHCVCSTGHSHPRVVDAITRQAQELLFYSAAAALSVRTRAAAALVAFAGPGVDSVFFCNSGAEANENALKLAAALTGRSRFVAFTGGFHGRTLLALSCSDLPGGKRGLGPLLADCALLPFGDASALAAADFSDVAAVIVEPIQSMAGVRCADAVWLRALADKCRAAGTLLVFDEVQTGFGRLGASFAFQQARVRPDFVTTAKGIASGIPMAALLMPEAIARELKSGDLGSTFGGGPVASAALLATLAVIEDESLVSRARVAGVAIADGLRETCVTEVRGTGLLLGLVVPGRAASLKSHLEAHGVLVGASADPDVLRLMPPLNVSDASIARLHDAVRAF